MGPRKMSETELLLEMARVYRMPAGNVWRFIRLPALFGATGGGKKGGAADDREEKS